MFLQNPCNEFVHLLLVGNIQYSSDLLRRLIFQAAYCYKELYSDNHYDMIGSILFSAVASSRAYLSLDDLVFTAKTADENHKMELPDGIYTPSGIAKKITPAVKAFCKYRNNTASKEILQAFLDAEQECPEISLFIFTPKLVVMSNISSTEECIDFIENNLDFVFSLPIEHEDYNYIIQLLDGKL